MYPTEIEGFARFALKTWKAREFKFELYVISIFGSTESNTLGKQITEKIQAPLARTEINSLRLLTVYIK